MSVLKSNRILLPFETAFSWMLNDPQFNSIHKIDCCAFKKLLKFYFRDSDFKIIKPNLFVFLPCCPVFNYV